MLEVNNNSSPLVGALELVLNNFNLQVSLVHPASMGPRDLLLALAIGSNIFRTSRAIRYVKSAHPTLCKASHNILIHSKKLSSSSHRVGRQPLGRRLEVRLKVAPTTPPPRARAALPTTRPFSSTSSSTRSRWDRSREMDHPKAKSSNFVVLNSWQVFAFVLCICTMSVLCTELLVHSGKLA